MKIAYTMIDLFRLKLHLLHLWLQLIHLVKVMSLSASQKT